jgi:hypothetical protein
MAAKGVVVSSQLYCVVRRAVRRLSCLATFAVFAGLAVLSTVSGTVSFGRMVSR